MVDTVAYLSFVIIFLLVLWYTAKFILFPILTFIVRIMCRNKFLQVENDRQESIRKLRSMGIKVTSDDESSGSYTSIR
ncbi:hypothetical protein [Oceanobacillus massiliensis]|uniref:hypothetical protein n=1 Tax=Oceanobacillus massiliensis TaxID=1465765 RepID=UPI003019C88C